MTVTRARKPAAAGARALTVATLSRWPFPPLGEDTDKESRGRVLIVAGSHEIPGAALLAGVAALRAGAGKLAIAAPERVAIGLALAIPEARVIGVAEARSGGFDARGCRAIEPVASRASAVVLGPGMLDERRSQRFVAALLPMAREATIVLDAYAMAVVDGPPFEQSVILTPHAGEMAHLTGLSKEAVNADPLGIALDAARRWNAVVVLKGSTTHIAEPGGIAWRFDGGSPGLATSGSGDTLAGLIGGFAARGLEPMQAAAWGVVMHALAGERLAQRAGPLGYLARELSAEVPGLLSAVRKPRTPLRGPPSRAVAAARPASS